MRAQYFLKVTSDEKGKISINYVSNFELNLKNLLGLQSQASSTEPRLRTFQREQRDPYTQKMRI